jgi:flagellar protein FlgJ
MKPEQFIKDLYPAAKSIEKKSGIPAVAIIAQAALESDWGKKAIGNNIFGIKDKNGVLTLTTEYSDDPHYFDGYKVESKELVGKKWMFKVWLRFAQYESVEACLTAHNRLLMSDRYKPCLRWKHSPKRYLIAIWRAGYASDKDYGKKVLGGNYEKPYYSIVDSVTRRIESLKL